MFCADDDKRLAKAADEGRLRKLRKEAQRESRLVKKKLQRQQDQDGRGTKQQPLHGARGWASDEEEFTQTLPRTDSGQAGVLLLPGALLNHYGLIWPRHRAFAVTWLDMVSLSHYYTGRRKRILHASVSQQD